MTLRNLWLGDVVPSASQSLLIQTYIRTNFSPSWWWTDYSSDHLACCWDFLNIFLARNFRASLQVMWSFQDFSCNDIHTQRCSTYPHIDKFWNHLTHLVLRLNSTLTSCAAFSFKIIINLSLFLRPHHLYVVFKHCL